MSYDTNYVALAHVCSTQPLAASSLSLVAAALSPTQTQAQAAPTPTSPLNPSQPAAENATGPVSPATPSASAANSSTQNQNRLWPALDCVRMVHIRFLDCIPRGLKSLVGVAVSRPLNV